MGHEHGFVGGCRERGEGGGGGGDGGGGGGELGDPRGLSLEPDTISFLIVLFFCESIRGAVADGTS